MSKPQAYSYLRYSARAQDHNDSLRRQTSLRDAWLAKKGLVLDESLVLPDFAVSAFRGKNLTKGALGQFIREVDAGRVPKGSFLVIEKLDRFSRADADEALPIFTRLVKSGIVVVTLEPEKEWTAEAIKGFGIMELVLHFVLANQESAKKSDRLKAVWAEKKRNAAKQLVTTRMPSWLRYDGNSIVVVTDKAKVVKRIFDLAEKGHGSSQIAIMLNVEGVPPFCPTKKDGTPRSFGWHGSSISKLLRSRQVLGEYTPCRITPEGPKRRVPVGDPIKGYYPAIVSEAQWSRVQFALDGRRNARGKIGRGVTNLFSGLIKDARDGGGLFLKALPRSAYFLPRNAIRGLSKDTFKFSYSTFERAFLTFFHELKPADLAPPKETGEELDSHFARLADLERRIETGKARMLKSPDFNSLLDVLEKLEVERKQVIESINAAQAATTQGQKRDLREAVSVIDLLAKAQGEELLELRARLKALIRALVEDIWILVEPWGIGRIGYVQVNFKGGGSRILHILSAGKGVSHLRGKSVESTVGSREKMLMTEVCDLRRYRSDETVRKVFTGFAEDMRQATPQAIATRQIKAGVKPYKVAKALGIASSTVYRWAAEV